MFKLYVKRKKAVMAGAAAILFASAFQPVGCNFNVDPALLNSVLDALTQIDFPNNIQFGGGHGHGHGDGFDGNQNDNNDDDFGNDNEDDGDGDFGNDNDNDNS